MDSMVDLNLPLEEIIKRKAEFDKAQADRFMADYKAAMALLANAPKAPLAYGIPPIVSASSKTVVAAPLMGGFFDETYVGEKKQPKPPVISQEIVKPLVMEFLSQRPGKHVTTEIFRFISSRVDTTKEPRSSWITSISLALNGLTKGNKPRVRKSDTDNGNIKAYEWIAA